jgi:hypothetical protein
MLQKHLRATADAKRMGELDVVVVEERVWIAAAACFAVCAAAFICVWAIYCLLVRCGRGGPEAGDAEFGLED